MAGRRQRHTSAGHRRARAGYPEQHIYSFRFHVFSGALALALGTGAAWILVFRQRVRDPASEGPVSPPGGILGYSVLKLSCVIFIISFLSALFVMIVVVGLGFLQTLIYTGISSAILPMSLVYQSARLATTLPAKQEEELAQLNTPARSYLRTALSVGFTLAPVGFSLAVLMALFLEVPLSFYGAGIPRPGPSLGHDIASGGKILRSAWWVAGFPLATVSLATGGFLAIALPIFRAQERLSAAFQAPAEGMVYAGFWVRIASSAFDSLVMSWAFFSLILLNLISSSWLGLVSGLLSFLALAVTLAYMLVYLGGLRQSAGNRVFGIEVVRTDGAKLSLGRAFVRALIIGLTMAFAPFIFPLVMLFNRRRRTLHDILAGTVVIKTRTPILTYGQQGPASEVYCRRCGAETLPEERFCKQCGAGLA